MKKRFLLACLTIGMLNSTMAQEKQLVSDLIKSKTFAFVVTKVENKLGMAGPLNNYTFPNLDAINPSTASMQTSQHITTNAPVGSFYLADYYRVALGSGSYFDAYNIQKKAYNAKVKAIDNSIFLVQQPQELLLKRTGSQSPTGSEELNSYSSEDFKLLSKKKKDNKWHLKYKVGDLKNRRVMYLTIKEDGNAVLQDQPNENRTTVLYGKILRVASKASS